MLYYLHLGRAVDEADYLPGFVESATVASLTYSAADHLFESPLYTACAMAALHEAEQRNADPASLLELRKHMNSGITQPEWLLSPEETEKILSETQDRSERNRLIALRMIAQARIAGEL